VIQVTPAFLNSIETTTNEKPSFVRDFKRYQIQSKRISQMIAFVWRYIEDSETAKELDKYFKNTKIGDKEYKLKDLLFAAPNPENPEEQIRFQLWSGVGSSTCTTAVLSIGCVSNISFYFNKYHADIIRGQNLSTERIF
jgi:hypothetical protein